MQEVSLFMGCKIKIFNKQIQLCFCHHLPERSISFFGIENYLCSRCFGTLIGALVGTTLFFLGIYGNLFTFLLLILPLIVDGITQTFNKRISNNSIRFSTGILFGIITNNLLIALVYVVNHFGR
jgi:uncharacterized membrane protein